MWGYGPKPATLKTPVSPAKFLSCTRVYMCLHMFHTLHTCLPELSPVASALVDRVQMSSAKQNMTKQFFEIKRLFQFI